MGAIDALFTKLKKFEDELRKLRGRIDAISVGNQIITPNIPGTANVPAAVENAVIVGNSTPAWERAVPVPGPGDTLVLASTFATPKPHFITQTPIGRYRMFVYTVDPGPPDFIFLTDGGGNPIFVLQDLE